jgi:uncharacterized protein YkwD
MKQFTLRIRLVICALAIAVLPVLAGVLALADEPADPAMKALLEAHNRERKKEHLGPLTLAPKLNEAARIHAADMAKHKKLSHTGSDGSNVVDRVKRVGYVYVRAGENVANGQESVDAVMKTWMKSPGHRANILANFTEMGAARVEDDEGANYWCVDFGIPMPKLEPEAAAAHVVEEINSERKAAGKALLKVHAKLGQAAMAISAAMAAKDKLETGSDPFKLIDENVLEGREIHLQLTSNVPAAKEAAKELAGQDPKELDSFREIGVGYAQAKSGTPYWCAIFAKPTVPRSLRKRQ